ncbi:MAG TPA: hypothetical protein VHT30_05010 [Acidimicrobiales bacterium]|jgi:Arc/MetJ family transcription regulator|nr:hypothetical protein [Acidimicrobiales bacterium]
MAHQVANREVAAPRPSGKTKLSLTLDEAAIAELRKRVGSRGLSSAVNQAVIAEVERLRRAEALDRWLGELDETDGPIDESMVAQFQRLWLPDH